MFVLPPFHWSFSLIFLAISFGIGYELNELNEKLETQSSYVSPTLI